MQRVLSVFVNGFKTRYSYSTGSVVNIQFLTRKTVLLDTRKLQGKGKEREEWRSRKVSFKKERVGFKKTLAKNFNIRASSF